jgi:hypothetical protein
MRRTTQSVRVIAYLVLVAAATVLLETRVTRTAWTSPRGGRS